MTDLAPSPGNTEEEINERLRADGQAPYTAVQDDYFGFNERYIFTLPDGKSFIEHKALTEGDRRQYLKGTNREVKFAKATQDASMKLSPGEDKAALLTVAITNWNLMRGGQPLPFSPANLRNFLEVANPKIIDLIHEDVTKHNPWLLNELSVEDLDREIAALQTQRDALLDADSGKATSKP